MPKSRMAMSPLTNILRRIHRAHRFSDQSGIPLDEVLDLQKDAQKKADAELEYQRERRRFLKAAGLTGLAMGMGLPTLAAAAQGGNGGNNGGDRGKVIVIGAGAGGLRTAHRLKQYGVSSTVYEANTRIGGRLFSTRGFFADDIVVERGGELISTEHSYVRNLVHQLNLELEDVGGGASGGGEEIFYLNNSLYTEAELAEDWRAIFPLFKDAESAAPWQPTYDNFNAEHQRLDWTPAPQWLDEAGVGSNSKLGQLLLADIVSEYGPSADVQQALNLIYLLAWNSINSPQPLAGTDERFHIVG
ncbi:hypothetical protein GCM10023116_39140 [Kistimonas scapharcae]|uniref:Tryptophan 2-monooxygenase n=1 Tax=Kistimonas scapharcae TaxID=1036133 RepID=A0ABP8V6H6_9GAMM